MFIYTHTHIYVTVQSLSRHLGFHVKSYSSFSYLSFYMRVKALQPQNLLNYSARRHVFIMCMPSFQAQQFIFY